MKGVLLAGGLGTRLFPTTIAITKHLLPIADKPMIYYPLSILMLMDIREIMLITTNRDVDCFRELFGDGKDLGIKIEYAIQDQPNGIAEAILIAEDFLDQDNFCLILGDNIFYGDALPNLLRKEPDGKSLATIFACYVDQPSEFGVVEFDEHGNAKSLEEKPKNPKSNYAVTGVYKYDHSAVSIAKKLQPSARGEIEITDLNKVYLEDKKLDVVTLGRGIAWLDTGTFDGITRASAFIDAIETMQGLKIACLEEIALNRGWISKAQIEKASHLYGASPYGLYVKSLLEDSN